MERAVVDAAANSTTTITADTDISSPILLEVDEDGADWCTVSSNGKNITVTATQANTETTFRIAKVYIRCGYRETEFTVLQKYDGQTTLEYDWTKWTATGSDVQENDGGGYSSLFTEDRGKFWHSNYSNSAPCPHWLLIDMKEELSCIMFRIARRGAGVNNYPSVKKLDIYASTDNENFTKVGGFVFALPWTAPDGTVVNGNSPLVPPYEEVTLTEPVTARYIKLVIEETNNTTGVAQVAYFKAYGEI
ncbi:MAG: discoidin domain-containing protein [Bacteroides sp.]|nr:discoidin domain-containing protein [Bacteroides sp.]